MRLFEPEAKTLLKGYGVPVPSGRVVESVEEAGAKACPPVVESLKVGQQVAIDGIIYMARDAAHERPVKLIENGQKLPFDLTGQIIFYVGPQPPRPGMAIGPAGPTSSYRMDPYAPILMAKDFPVIVVNDIYGNDLCRQGKEQYRIAM
jgi:tartrate dehydratase beta subunit/fumarate hydratase class I family protein